MRSLYISYYIYISYLIENYIFNVKLLGKKSFCIHLACDCIVCLHIIIIIIYFCLFALYYINLHIYVLCLCQKDTSLLTRSKIKKAVHNWLHFREMFFFCMMLRGERQLLKQAHLKVYFQTSLLLCVTICNTAIIDDCWLAFHPALCAQSHESYCERVEYITYANGLCRHGNALATTLYKRKNYQLWPYMVCVCKSSMSEILWRNWVSQHSQMFTAQKLICENLQTLYKINSIRPSHTCIYQLHLAYFMDVYRPQ